MTKTENKYHSKVKIKALLNELAEIMEDKAQLDMHNEIGSGKMYLDKFPEYLDMIQRFTPESWIKFRMKNISDKKTNIEKYIKYVST